MSVARSFGLCSSSLVRLTFALVLGSSLAPLGCSSGETKTAAPAEATPEAEGETAQDPDAWTGQPIEIESDGVEALDGEGGIVIEGSANAKKVTATVEADAPKTGSSAPKTQPSPSVTISQKASRIAVQCVRAGTTGLGCKKLTVKVPRGTADQPLLLTVKSGNGGIRLDDTLVVGALSLTESGPKGDVVARFEPVVGATIELSSKKNVSLAVPATFAADEIDFGSSATIDAAAFPGMESGKGFGESGAGVKLLRVRGGTITVTSL